jgi:hypothetical protein
LDGQGLANRVKMNTDVLQKKSGRKRRKPLKIYDGETSDDGEGISSQPQPPPVVQAAEGQVVKKKRGRKPGQGI